MIVSLALLFGAFASFGVIAHHLQTAPEAFEDNTGFHIIKRLPTAQVRRKSAERRCAAVFAARKIPIS